MTVVTRRSFNMSLFRSTVTYFILLSIFVSVVISITPYTCQECLSSGTCHPPACSCCGDHMPMLASNNTPQMVFFTFDDAITPPVANYYRELFDSRRTNPNGCPIKMTLFVSHANTVYNLVREFYQKGMEIGAHSVSHGHMNKRTFKSEAKKQKENINRMAGVPMSEIKGWRSPFLEPIGDEQPKSLNELDYTYDATLTISKKGMKKPPIPFTLDYGWPYDCKIKSCPRSHHNGFWEVPVVSVMDHLERFDCVYVDGCHTPPPNEDAAFKFLWDNFNTYYSGNRAPFGMNMHASWFYYPDRLRAMNRFIKVLTSLPDVYVVSVSQVIDWLKKPTPLSDIHHFKPWGCKNPKAISHHRGRNHQVLLPRVSVKRNNLVTNNLEQQRKLRAQQARANFMRRQQQRQKDQQRLFQQHGIQNPQQVRQPEQTNNNVQLASSTLGRQQYMWLQRQRSRPTVNTRNRNNRFSSARSRISWQRALRHQVMRQIQHQIQSTTPPSMLWESGVTQRSRNTMIQPSEIERRRQKKLILQKRKMKQLEIQNKLLRDRQNAEQKVIAEERRIAEKKRKDALLHTQKENTIKAKTATPNTVLSMSTAAPKRKNKTQSKKELKELLRFAENNLVQSRLLFGVGKLKKVMHATHNHDPQQQQKPQKILADIKQSSAHRQQQTVVASTTSAPVKEKTTKSTKSKTLPAPKQSVNSQNFLRDSIRDVVGTNKELWTWAIPKSRVSAKQEKRQSSTLPPIKVATTGGFVDFNPTAAFSAYRTVMPKIEVFANHQTTIKPSFRVTSVKYSLPNEADFVNPSTGLEPTPMSVDSVLTQMRPSLPSEICQQDVSCFSPNCQCLSIVPPGNLKTTHIPQIIYITIDGDVNFSAFSKMRSLFSRKRKNPNGCHIGGTMFVSPKGSSVSLVDRIHRDNVEIALRGSKEHGYTHGKLFASDIDAYKSKLSKASSLSASNIQGYRGYDLQPLNDDGMEILKNKTMYDSTLITTSNAWPFTLDFGWKGECKNGECPTREFPGVWEVPIVPMINTKTKESCDYADGCKTQPSTKDDTFDYLVDNFSRHYKSARSPFGIHLRQKWLHWYYHHNLAGLSKFMDYVLLLKDVYIVSTSDMLEWVKQPTSLKHLKDFQPWQC